MPILFMWTKRDPHNFLPVSENPSTVRDPRMVSRYQEDSIPSSQNIILQQIRVPEGYPTSENQLTTSRRRTNQNINQRSRHMKECSRNQSRNIQKLSNYEQEVRRSINHTMKHHSVQRFSHNLVWALYVSIHAVFCANFDNFQFYSNLFFKR